MIFVRFVSVHNYAAFGALICESIRKMSRFNVVPEIPCFPRLKVEAQSTLSGTIVTPHNILIKIFKLVDGPLN